MNYFSLRKNTQYRTAIFVVIASSVGSYLTAPLKEKLPTAFVALTLALISLYALYGVWAPANTSTAEDFPPRENKIISIITGLILGVLTTFTGLGGGVLMLPLFLNVFKYSHPQAIATSLLAVGFSSMASLVIQIINGTRFETNQDLALLLIGVWSSVFLLKQFTKRLPQPIVNRTRQVVFTFVVILALSKIF
jgi:uncharacterized membrane protein YfcA